MYPREWTKTEMVAERGELCAVTTKGRACVLSQPEKVFSLLTSTITAHAGSWTPRATRIQEACLGRTCRGAEAQG